MMTPRARSAFTLIELMVVVAVIAVLIGAIIGIGASVIAGGKARDTEALLKAIETAVQQFQQEAPFAGVPNYNTRYADDYPPDELEAFTKDNDFGGELFDNVSPGGADLVFQWSPSSLGEVQYRDIKAMSLAISLYNPEACSILERIDNRFRRLETNISGDPLEYLDRESVGGVTNEPLVYYVDSWGTPIEYYSTSDLSRRQAASDPGNLRKDASTSFVRANNGVPLLVSYGPNGPEQFSPAFISSEGPSDLVSDYHDDGAHLIDHRLNDDNVYSNSAVVDKLREGQP